MWHTFFIIYIAADGRREGSGRPVGERSKSVCLRLSPESLAILKQQPNQSEFVDELIKAAKE